MSSSRGVSIIGVLISMAVLAILYFYVSKMYMNKQNEAGVSAANPASAVDRAQSAADRANNLIKKQEADINASQCDTVHTNSLP